MNLSENKDRFISKRLETSLKDLLEYQSPGFLGKHIRKMTFLYLRQSLREGFPVEMADFLDQLDVLLDFLDTAEEETSSRTPGAV